LANQGDQVGVEAGVKLGPVVDGRGQGTQRSLLVRVVSGGFQRRAIIGIGGQPG
jgi:hypothetical protein